MPLKSINPARGFSLVELMIASALGVLLIGGSLTIFAGSIRTADVSQAVASLQSGARYALDTIATDMRSAGYRGCAAPEDSSLSISVANAPDGILTTDVLRGAFVTSGGWLPDEPSGYIPLKTPVVYGVPINGTYALILQYGMGPGSALASSMSATSSDLVLSGTGEQFAKNDFGIISDCNGVDVFKVDSLSATTTDQTVSTTSSLSRPYLVNSSYAQSTRVMRLVGAIYYIGDTGRENTAGDDIHALFLQSFPFDPVNNPPFELIEGVDQLQLRFGITNADGSIQHVLPNSLAVNQMNTIDTVNIALLMTTIDPVHDAPVAREFQLAGRKVIPREDDTTADTPAYTPDRRLRIPYSKTIKLRNRNL